MAVLLQTSLGELTIDLYIDEVPILAANFLKLCKAKIYNNTLFYSVEKNFVARAGPIEDKSILSELKLQNEKEYKKLSKGNNKFWVPMSFNHETGTFKEFFHPNLKHNKLGVVSMGNQETNQIGSTFFITLRDKIDYLDNKKSIIGYVAEGLEILDKINKVIVEDYLINKPLVPIRILHTIILEDPFPDLSFFIYSLNSPIEIKDEVLENIATNSDQDKNIENEIEALERIAKAEAKSRAIALEILGDVPDAELAPPDNVLFICKLNPITEAEDLEMIFSRFGKIISCDIIRDWKTGDSLQYGFIEYEDTKSCNAALFKMEGSLIDDRRVHVDFCQSVPKQWSAYKLHRSKEENISNKNQKSKEKDYRENNYDSHCNKVKKKARLND